MYGGIHTSISVHTLHTFFRLGDQIASVNKISLLNITHEEAVATLMDCGDPLELVRDCAVFIY